MKSSRLPALILCLLVLPLFPRSLHAGSLRLIGRQLPIATDSPKDSRYSAGVYQPERREFLLVWDYKERSLRNRRIGLDGTMGDAATLHSTGNPSDWISVHGVAVGKNTATGTPILYWSQSSGTFVKLMSRAGRWQKKKQLYPYSSFQTSIAYNPVNNRFLLDNFLAEANGSLVRWIEELRDAASGADMVFAVPGRPDFLLLAPWYQSILFQPVTGNGTKHGARFVPETSMSAATLNSASREIMVILTSNQDPFSPTVYRMYSLRLDLQGKILAAKKFVGAIDISSWVTLEAKTVDIAPASNGYVVSYPLGHNIYVRHLNAAGAGDTPRLKVAANLRWMYPIRLLPGPENLYLVVWQAFTDPSDPWISHVYGQFVKYVP